MVLSSMEVSLVHCVLLGDVDAGKSSMMEKYAQFSAVPYSHERGELVTAINGRKAIFSHTDTTPSDEENRSFESAHVFLLCVSVAKQGNVEETVEKIMSTVTNCIRNVPFVLVGTQIDKRTTFNYGQAETSTQPMPLHKAEDFAKKIGAVKYLECSAATGEGLDEVFEEAFAVGYKFATEQMRCDQIKRKDIERITKGSERKQSCIQQ